ncbi:MAG: hypothetical protein AAGG44_14040 [Planctomycetota bacterium]
MQSLSQFIAVLVICLSGKCMIAWLKGTLSYNLMSLKGQAVSKVYPVATLVFLFLALLVFTLRGPSKSLVELSAIVAACWLVYRLTYPQAQLREHGIFCGCTFTPWNNISRFRWEQIDESFVALMLQGPWFGERRVVMHQDQQDVANGVISGAARLEPTTPARFWLNTVGRSFAWLAATIVLWFLAMRFLS